jgi:hypothetical protein
MAQLWRKPTSVHAGGPALATGYGAASDGIASVSFSADQLAIELTADAGYYDDLWMVVQAVQESQPVALRWGWMRLVEAGFNPAGEIFSVEMDFVVVDDTGYITYNGQTFSLPLTFVGPATVSDGLITAADDVLYFNYAGNRWSSPATRTIPPPVGSPNGHGVVIDDVLYVRTGGVCYAVPVVAGEGPPEVTEPGEDDPTSTLVTGSDGAEYERTTYPDGTVRFKPVYEDIAIVPGEIPESGSTLVTGTDGAQYERTVYYDGTIRFKPIYEELP